MNLKETDLGEGDIYNSTESKMAGAFRAESLLTKFYDIFENPS